MKLMYLIVIFMVISLGIGFYFLFFQMESLTTTEDPCKVFSNANEKDGCYYAYVINGTISFEFCSKIQSSGEARGYCELLGFALFFENNDDSDSCLELGNGSLLDGRSYRDLCYSEFSTKLNDPSLCKKIEDEYTRENCEILSGQVDDCEGLSDSELKDACYHKKAIDENCILSEEDNSKCFHQELCDKIENIHNKNFCLMKVGSVLKDDSICEKIIGSESRKNYCLSSVASASGNIEECENFDTTNKESCYYDIAVESNDQSICELITLDSKRDDCYFQIFLDLNDVEICDKIIGRPGNDINAKCKAIYYEDPSYCEEDTCFYGLALNLKDSSICDLMPEEVGSGYTIDMCHGAVETYNS